MKKICAGTWRDEGIKWFSELSDKGKSYEFFLKKYMYINFTICHTNKWCHFFIIDTAKATKTHFYWTMRNNDGTTAGFQQYLLNIVDHYQVNYMYKYFRDLTVSLSFLLYQRIMLYQMLSVVHVMNHISIQNIILLFHYEKNIAPQVNVPAKPIEFFFYVVMN